MCLGTGVWEVGGRTEARRPVGTRPCEGAGTLSWGDRAWGGGGGAGSAQAMERAPGPVGDGPEVGDWRLGEGPGGRG